ncbi:MAG: hypothetical protein H5T45_01235 [Thermoplasmatales archaeon]|nr:hypothetical protein [Thermoplasmatales archaeon]
MKRTNLLLLIIFASAVIIRAIPIILYGAWGNDFGIYFYLTKKFIETRDIFINYTGWGSSYNFFPTLYISASILCFFGMNEIYALSIIGPIFGGLCILIFYFIAREIGFEKKLSLMCSIILAVLPVHAYQTSHSAPLTVGHFFLLVSFLFYLKTKKDGRWYIPLYISTILLIFSHHLTTYFYLISIIFAIFWSEIKNNSWSKNIVKDVFYVLFSLTSTFLYWAFIAKPVYLFMEGKHLSPLEIIILSYVLFLLSFIFIKLRRKYFVFKKIEFENDFLTFSMVPLITIICVAVGQFLILGYISIKFVAFSIPFSLIGGFGAIGWRKTENNYIKGWLLAIFSSIIFSISFDLKSLYIERHIEYLSEPLAIFVGYGISYVAKHIKSYEISTTRKINFSYNAFAIFISILLITNVASIYPLGEYSANICEGIPESTINLIEWMNKSISKDNLILSDHRISNLLFAYGFNTTYDKNGNTWCQYKIWTEDDWRNCIDELSFEGERISYIVIDDIMVKKGVVIDVYKSIAITNASYEKFQEMPFKLIYRNCTYKIPLEKINSTIDCMDYKNEEIMKNVLHWAEIYELDWNYIENELS